MRPLVLLLVLLLAPVGLSAQTESFRTTDEEQTVDVGGAFADSLRLLMIEHGTRIAFQAKTRRQLGGDFWNDYRRSVRWPGQWHDGDAWWVNYIGHPIHGAAAGYIWIDHTRDPAPPTLSRYLASRARATAFAATYSLQFEIGPLSEASIGNVGLRPETTGWVDHVVTPLGAFGLMVGEDALDRWLVRRVEARTGNRAARAAVRLIANPGRALANAAAGRVPWYRPDRPLTGSPGHAWSAPAAEPR